MKWIYSQNSGAGPFVLWIFSTRMTALVKYSDRKINSGDILHIKKSSESAGAARKPPPAPATAPLDYGPA